MASMGKVEDGFLATGGRSGGVRQVSPPFPNDRLAHFSLNGSIDPR
jgi:hypothetical protein